MNKFSRIDINIKYSTVYKACFVCISALKFHIQIMNPLFSLESWRVGVCIVHFPTPRSLNESTATFTSTAICKYVHNTTAPAVAGQHYALRLAILRWPRKSAFSISIELRVRAKTQSTRRVPQGRELYTQTLYKRIIQNKSQKTIPQASIQAVPGSRSVTTQDLGRSGEPRQRALRLLIAT